MHKIVICRECFEIIAQCRCMRCDKTIIYDVCEKCKVEDHKEVVQVFYLNGDKLKFVTTTDECETIKYLKLKGFEIIGRDDV
jgi:hypothetical protein